MCALLSGQPELSQGGDRCRWNCCVGRRESNGREMLSSAKEPFGRASVKQVAVSLSLPCRNSEFETSTVESERGETLLAARCARTLLQAEVFVEAS